MATNKKKPTNNKNKIVVKPTNKKPVANKKVTVKPVSKKPTVKKPVVKKPVTKPAEVKIEQVMLSDQIPATINICCKESCKKKNKTKYIVAGIIVVALLLAVLF